MDQMDSSPHSHQPLHIQPSEDYEGSSVANSSAQTIEIPEGSHGVDSTVSTPGYEYQSAPNSPPTKRGNDAKPPADDIFPFPKRLRVNESNMGQDSSACSAPTSPNPLEASSSESGLERSTSHRFKPSSTCSKKQLQYRSTSLPPSLRRKRRQPDSPQAHIPPVTLSTLRELDLHEIYRNPKLRHDVVFDSQLHFRPNLDGSRGRRKREQADMYWQLVLQECEMLLGAGRSKQNGKLTITPIKLPILLSTMRDILLTLVPKADKIDVEAVLDAPLLMQQLEHGCLDFKRLAQWLAGILKAHCAPMRDQWVEKMVAKVTYGVDNMKTAALVEGLKMVFGILEAMKLDVANHQIRTLRPHLVSTAIGFEQGYFQDKINTGRLDMKEPREWFHNALSSHKPTGVSNHVVCFTDAVVDMLTPSHCSKYPATFTFDYERLEALRDDIREATCLKISILFFRQLTLSSKKDVNAATIEKLRSSISAILGEEDGVSRWLRNSNSVALHIAQSACEFDGGSKLADASLVRIAENWMAKHLQMNSPIYLRIEKDLIKEVANTVSSIMKGWSSLSTFPIMQTADVTGSSTELASISQRISHISFLHWRIFGKMYLA